MSLKIIFPDDIEELAAALDGISEATAQVAQDGPESLEAFRLGVRVAIAALVKATGGRLDQPSQPVMAICPLKGIYAAQSNDYYCCFYQGRCPLLADPAYDYLTCPGWHEYEKSRRHIYA